MADPILSAKQIGSYYKWSIWARPLTMYSMVTVLMTVTFTVCWMVLSKQASLNDASGVFLAIVGAVFPILGAQIIGKSWERTKGVSEENVVQATRTPTVPASDGSNSTTIVVNDLGKLADPSALLTGDPMDALNQLDLSEYTPKIADDKPVVE